MLVGGLDVGSGRVKALLMEDGSVLGRAILETGPRAKETAERAFALALEGAGRRREEVAYCVGTGERVRGLEFVREERPILLCLARACSSLVPEAGTVVEVGANTTRVAVMEGGRVVDYGTNDRCAAGAGRFLELLGEALGIGMGEWDAMVSRSTKKLSITSQCTVFAESEVVALLNEGEEVQDVVAAVTRAIAGRVSSIVRKVGMRGEVAVAGGVGRLESFVRALEEQLGRGVKRLPLDPILAGAYGACLLAREKADEALR
ncbi:MAG: acyl-CoA dehydratase activase [Candidatus Hadarchaeales archaeon]